jgi:predicted amidohydrolase
MVVLRVAAVQMRSSRSVMANIAAAEALVREAAAEGARYVQTPEMTNLLDRGGDLSQVVAEEADPTLLRMRTVAAELGIHLHLGSLAIGREDGKVANRSFVLAPDGSTAARYDKIHMFDVDLDGGESWRESATYTAGDRAVTLDVDGVRTGLAVCYDLRFPALFRSYGHAGVDMLTVPAAFTRQTGEAHWHVLLRARAIENGAYVIAAAQGGRHEDGRETFGHSLVVDPWGKIVAEAAGDAPGVIHATIDTGAVAAARARIPALANERPFTPSVTA